MTRRGRVALAAGLLLSLVAAVAIASIPPLRNWVWTPVLIIPPAEEIAEMRVSVLEKFGLSAVHEFVVPKDHVPQILHWVRPTRYWEHGRVPDGFECGQLYIRGTDDREVNLRFYDMGMNPNVFTPDGKTYFCGGWYGPLEDGRPAKFQAVRRLIQSIREASPNDIP